MDSKEGELFGYQVEDVVPAVGSCVDDDFV